MSVPISPERKKRAREAQVRRVREAVAAGQVPADIGEALSDPSISRWRAAAGFSVVDTLDNLRGPGDGEVIVPSELVRLGAPRRVSLSDAAGVKLLYRILIADGSEDHQATLLNRHRLREMWQPGLAEPAIMKVWERRFPELKRDDTGGTRA